MANCLQQARRLIADRAEMQLHDHAPAAIFLSKEKQKLLLHLVSAAAQAGQPMVGDHASTGLKMV